MFDKQRLSYGKSYKNNSGEKMVHKISITERNSGTITGVLEVIEFDNNMVDLSTTLGRLIIKGHDLHVKKLNLEIGELDIEGTVDNLVYSTKASNESMLKRLFR